MIRRSVGRLALVAVAWAGAPAHAVLGDLNLDGRVDLDDYFIFADHYGQEGPPDTLRVVVLDTLQVEIVYDTVTVEFVRAPDTLAISEPDQVIRVTYMGEPVSQIALTVEIYPDDNRLNFLTLHRQPIDAEDAPSLRIPNDVRVLASVDVRYVVTEATDSLTVVAVDSVQLLQAVYHLSEIYQYGEGRVEYAADTARYPELAGTVGEIHADIVLRTPQQGDHAARFAQPARVTSVGRITR